MLNCIHHHFGEPCRKPATMKSHGWLCDGHYQQQQRSIPPAARKAQPRWRGLLPQTDAQIVADIIVSDAYAIETGRIVRVVRGATDPIVLRLLD